MRFGNVQSAMEFQERAKMADWELIYVTDALCDECEELQTCNIYRTPLTCICNKCDEMKRIHFRYRNICGACLSKWLKSRELD